MISINNLSIEFSSHVLFDNINYVINPKDKIALVGKNGAGKSTMLKIIAGLQRPTEGSVSVPNDVTIGYLPQQMVLTDTLTVVEEVRKVFAHIADMQKRLDKMSQELSERSDYESEEYQQLIERVSNLTEELALASSENCEAELEKTLLGLGFVREDFNRPTSEFSGGWRMRIELAKLLLRRPDVLLLDEPTNHLDIATIEWLEAYLRRSRATLMMVTHDRYFLDRVCGKILELDHQSAFMIEGNYDMYLRRRAERIEAMDAELARVRNTLRKEQEWMSRQPQARAGKAKFRIDAFYDLRERSKKTWQEKNIRLENSSSRIGSKIFEAENVCKRFGDKVILDNFTYTFARGEKLGIVGPNGVGKSTFIKLLQGLVPLDSGKWDLGETLRFGYYSQDGISFDRNKRVIDAVTELAEDIELKEGIHLSPMQYLQRFLFEPADQQKYIHTLSGGERCRLHLATVLMRQPNFLILDEPTNDLDIVTLNILEEYLKEFGGSLIIVSHDRHFLDKLVDHLFVFCGNGVVKDFVGSYSEYREYIKEYEAEQRAKERAAEKAIREPQKQDKPAQKKKLTYKEQREFEQIEKDLEALAVEKATLEEALSSGTLPFDKLQETSERIGQIIEETDEKEMRWLELSELAS